MIGLALSVYGAAGAFGAARRALNRVAHVEDSRAMVRRKALELGCTVVVIVLAVVAFVLVFLGGSLSEFVFSQVGLGSTTAAVWPKPNSRFEASCSMPRSSTTAKCRRLLISASPWFWVPGVSPPALFRTYGARSNCTATTLRAHERLLTWAPCS